METFEKEKEVLPKAPVSSQPAEPVTETAAPPLPVGLRYLMLGLLVVGILGAVTFAFVRQNSIKPTTAATTNQEDCADPITENQLRENVGKSPNDFNTLMDWGDYNLRCRQPADYVSAISAYQNAIRLAENPANNIQSDNRLEAHLNLGLAYLYNGNFKPAQDEFKLVLNEQPQNTFVLLVLGGALVKDDPQQALVYLKQVIALSPGTKIAENAQVLINDINSKGSASPSPGAATPKS